MKKKILFLGPFPPPYYGSSILCEEIYNFLKRSKKIDVKRIKLNYSKEFNDLGKINFNKIYGIFNVRKQIIKEIQEFNPDFIYFAPATKGLGLVRDAYFSKIVKKMNKPIVFHMHSRVTPKIRSKGINERLLKHMLENERAIVLGKELIEDIKWVIPKKKITVITNAMKNNISNDQIKLIIKKRRRQKKINILFLSNMIKSKGWPQVLSTAKILKDDGFNFQINFVGSWPSKKEEKEFFSFVSKNNLKDCVNYLGVKKDKEKNKVFESANIFVFPTNYDLETFGLVITEAMMYALPVIANGVATIPSIVEHNRTGYILKKNNTKEISGYIKKLLKNYKLRENMGILARKRFLSLFEMREYEKKLSSFLKSQ